MISIKRTLGFVCVLLAAPALVTAQPVGVITNWTNPSQGDWNQAANWDTGIPNVNMNDFAVISRSGGGTALVNSASPEAGGVYLGLANGESGSLEIQSGGTLEFKQLFDGDGSVHVGFSGGLGTLRVLPGGMLTSLSLLSGGDSASAIILGGTGAGNAVVNTGPTTLARTTRVIGSQVDFESSGDMTLGVESNLIAEITGPDHSTLKAQGSVTLAGNLQVEFNGHSPGVGDVWELFDAAQVTGSFAAIESPTPLPMGEVFDVRTRAGGMNGQIAELVIDQQLFLRVDRDTRAVTIENSGSAPIEIDGYSVRSNVGGLNQGNWQTFGTPWQVSNASAAQLAELTPAGSSTIAATTSTVLGNVFNPAPSAFGEVTDDIVFDYTGPNDLSVSAAVEYIGIEGINNLTLIVDPMTGETQMRNTSNFTIEIDGYTIASESGSLRTGDANWISLDDQNADNGSWEESNVSSNRLSELQRGDATTLASNGLFDLGLPFDPAGLRDLQFELLLAGSPTGMNGVVVYQEIPDDMAIPGDYNNNGAVEQADLDLVLLNWGKETPPVPDSWENDPPEGQIDQAELDKVLLNWGNVAGVAAAVAVPEPASLALLGCFFLVGIPGFARRR